jgi:hypothetical protein
VKEDKQPQDLSCQQTTRKRISTKREKALTNEKDFSMVFFERKNKEKQGKTRISTI